MARPIKEGLEYFPLNCDIDQDDKIALIEAQHGLIGFGITIKLLMKIYDNSYFYKWTEKEQLLFSKRVNVDINLVNVVINDLVKWNFFDENIFNTYKVLTSKGIQQRYLDATGRRQKVKIQEEYLLLDQETVNAYKNLVIVDNNSNSTVVNVDISTQRKEKKSKVKESKENNNKEKDSLLLLWEQLGFGTINSVIVEDLKLLEETYTEAWVKEAMEEATRQNKRNVKYVKGILKNWKENGFKAEKKQQVKNNSNGNGFNNFQGRNYTEEFNKLQELVLTGQADEEERERYYKLREEQR